MDRLDKLTNNYLDLRSKARLPKYVREKPVETCIMLVEMKASRVRSLIKDDIPYLLTNIVL